jgi:aspartate aminotransferase-like enzyme
LDQNFANSSAAQDRFLQQRELGRWVRAQIRASGLSPIAAEQDAAPTITSFPLPAPGFARFCRRAGFRIAHESDYLRTRGWGQIATMGNISRSAIEPVFAALLDRLPTPAEQ